MDVVVVAMKRAVKRICLMFRVLRCIPDCRVCNGERHLTVLNGKIKFHFNPERHVWCLPL